MKKYITIFGFIIPLLGFGQYEFYNAGSVVYVQKGAVLHVQGSLTNAPAVSGPTGAFTDDGIVEIDGNFNALSGTIFQPDLSTNSSDRMVKLTGLGTQYIMGTVTPTFYNLVLDKQSATDTVMMQTNAVITGSLIFNTRNTFSSLYPSGVTTITYNPSNTTADVTNNGYGGLLKTFDQASGTEYLLDVQNPGVDAINGYPALAINGNPSTAYILTKGASGSANGGLQRAIGSVASYVYPIGTYLHGFNATRFNFTSVPTGNPTVKGKFCDYQTSASGGYTGTIDVTCVGCWGNYVMPDNLGYNYYFQNDPCTGHPQWFIIDGLDIKHGYWTYTSSNNSAFQYSVEMFPNNMTGPQSLTLEDWRVLKFDDVNHAYGYDPSQQNWTSQILSQVSTPTDLLTWTLNAGCYTGPGIPGGVYTGFSEFSLDKSNSDQALPVTIISLQAYPVNNTFIQVAWVTALEINNHGFNVQRSTDGVNFTTIGWVPGHGNSTVQNNYTYNDDNVVPEIVYYYRLLQVDNNGNETPTDVVQASISGGSDFIVSDFIPNPANGNSKIIITSPSDLSVNIRFFDVIGRQVGKDKVIDLATGENTISFNTQTLAAGNYTAVINCNNALYTKRLVVVRE